MDEIKRIRIENIIVTKDNPRQTFDEEPLKRLGESIRSHGLIQPIIVRRKEGYYELVVGERRLRAAQLVGLTEIEAKIEDIDNATCMELRLIENTHREDLTDAEKGDAVYMLIQNYPDKYSTVKSVAEAINTPSGTIQVWTRKSRKISDQLREYVGASQITEKAANYLLKHDHEIQDKLGEIAVKYEMSERQAIKFFKLYDANPERDLDDLADEAMGIKTVEIPVEKLSPEARREVEEIIEEKRELMEKARKEAIEKARKAPRRRPPRRKPKPEVRPEVPIVPSVPAREEGITPTVEAPSPEVERIPERPETKGVVLTALVPTDLFGKVTSLAAERRATLGETVVYIIEQFFKRRELYVD